MSFKNKEYKEEIWVQCICDNCGAIANNEEEGWDLMPDEAGSAGLALEAGWDVNNNNSFCPDCTIIEEE